jgi:hypothetical protein
MSRWSAGLRPVLTNNPAFCFVCSSQGHEVELLDQLTGGRVVPTAAGEGGAAADDAPAPAAAPEAEAFRPSTFSFLRSVTLRSEEDERAEEGEAAESVDPAAAEATRRAFDAAVLAQWQRLRALRVG